MQKGIFWIKQTNEIEIIKISAICDLSGKIYVDSVDFSSKSGENFNHKAEWAKLPKSITEKYSYNYYPRGRVEIKNGRITIYINPDINREDVLEVIIKEFELEEASSEIRIKSDGSYHYKYLEER